MKPYLFSSPRRNKIFLSIVIPAYNEVGNIKKGVLAQVSTYLRTVNFSYEVIIVDDGSTDDTRILVKNWIRGKEKWCLVENEHGGKALAVMTGLLAAKGDIALFTDMDQATPIGQVEKFLPKFAERYNVVIGSRTGRKGAPILRKLAAWGFTFLRSVILGLPLSDTQCGFKAFDKKSREAIFPRMMESWEKMRAHGAAVHAGFDVETLYLAKKMEFKIAEVPVEWQYVGTERVQLIKDSIDAIKDILRIRWYAIKGEYK
ncbi:MAG: glycosyltransferase [Candidatus Blackburnbacteria bacterium]|nr:glycosyltransferase [Candidatus Blackburnbacteria bacterium]